MSVFLIIGICENGAEYVLEVHTSWTGAEYVLRQDGRKDFEEKHGRFGHYVVDEMEVIDP